MALRTVGSIQDIQKSLGVVGGGRWLPKGGVGAGSGVGGAGSYSAAQGGTTTNNLISNFQAQQESARQANEQRYAEALELYNQVIKQYEPGGGFGAGYEAQLGRQKTKTIAGQQQQLVSSGLFGTSITAGLGQKFEEEVGQPARLKLEDLRKSRYGEAIGAKAGFIERREDVGPDYSLIAQLASQAANRPQQQPATRTTSSYGSMGGWLSSS